MVTFIACCAVIGIVVFTYEKKLEKMRKLNLRSAKSIKDLIDVGNQMTFDYFVLIELLKENYTDEEINEKFIKKSEEMIKNSEENENE